MELIKLESLEKEVESGFLQAARALREIKESNLYQQDYGTWENYLKERWGYSRDQWLKLSQSFSVINNLNDAQWAYLPQNQRQARELAPLQPEQQIEVWQEVTETYQPEEITAGKIKETKDKLYGDNGLPEIDILSHRIEYGIHCVGIVSLAHKIFKQSNDDLNIINEIMAEMKRLKRR